AATAHRRTQARGAGRGAARGRAAHRLGWARSGRPRAVRGPQEAGGDHRRADRRLARRVRRRLGAAVVAGGADRQEGGARALSRDRDLRRQPAPARYGRLQGHRRGQHRPRSADLQALQLWYRRGLPKSRADPHREAGRAAEMNPAGATREVFWNVTHIWVMYALLVPTTLIAGYGIYRKIRLWRAGKPLPRFDRVGQRIGLVIKHALAQRRTARQTYAGAFHLMLYGGFVILTLATLVVMVHEDFKLRIMQGAFYLYFQSFVVDIFGVLV